MLNYIISVWNLVVFFVSGLLINVLQFCCLPLYWIHRKSYHSLISKLCYCSYSQLTFLAEWWGSTKLTVYGEMDVLKKLQNGNVVIVMNHFSDIDWLIGWVLAERIGVLGSVKAVIKHAVKYLPTLGWSWWFSEFVFIKRNWQKDKNHFLQTMAGLKERQVQYSMTLYCEGTRRTEEKLKISQEYAVRNNMLPLKYHLLPRTKGFSLMIHELRDNVAALYDFEIAFSNPEKCTFLSLINREKIDAHLHLRCIPISSVPMSSLEDTTAFCHQLYQEKDKLYEYFVKHGNFPGEEIHVPRRMSNLITFFGSNVVVSIVIISVFRYVVFLFGTVFTVIFLIVLGICSMLYLDFS